MPSFEIPESAQSFVGLNVAPRVERDDATKQEHDADGQPLWEVRVATISDPEPGQGIRVPMPEIVRVTVAGARPQVVPGAPTRFRGLTLRSWRARDGREGLMYTADAVVPPGAQAAPGPTASATRS